MHVVVGLTITVATLVGFARLNGPQAVDRAVADPSRTSGAVFDHGRLNRRLASDPQVQAQGVSPTGFTGSFGTLHLPGRFVVEASVTAGADAVASCDELSGVLTELFGAPVRGWEVRITADTGILGLPPEAFRPPGGACRGT